MGIDNGTDLTGKGDDTMSKTKARQRAKANALKKAKKRAAAAAAPEQQFGTGNYDPTEKSITSANSNTNLKNLGGAKKGAARSR